MMRHWDCRWCICIVMVGPSQAWFSISSAWAQLDTLWLVIYHFGLAWVSFNPNFYRSTSNGLIVFLVIVFPALKDNVRIDNNNRKWPLKAIFFLFYATISESFFSYLYSFKIHHIVLLPPLATMMGLEPNLRQLWVSVISCFTICRNHKICEWEFFQIFHEFELKNSILSNVLWNEMVELLNLVVNRIL